MRGSDFATGVTVVMVVTASSPPSTPDSGLTHPGTVENPSSLPERIGDQPGISLIRGIRAPDSGSVTWKGRTSVPTYLVERYSPA